MGSSKAHSVASVETRSGSALTDAVQVIIANKNRLDRTSSASKYVSHPQRIITKGAETNTVPLMGPSGRGWTLHSDRMLYISQPEKNIRNPVLIQMEPTSLRCPALCSP